jgi:glycosyltransferase involved in cell wall biosynthesis
VSDAGRPTVDGAGASAALRAELATAEERFAANDVPVRLLFLIGGLGPGGAERQAVHLLENLPARAIAARLACFAGYEEDLRRVARAGVPIDFLATSGGRLWPLPMLRTLDRIVRRHRVTLVQSFLETFDILAPCLRVRRPGLRVVTSRRNIDEQLSPRHLRLLRMTGRLARVVVGNSAAVVESVRRLEGLPADRVVGIPNGIELPAPIEPRERAEARQALGIADEAFVVSYAAHFRRGKGHDHLPRACRAWMKDSASSVLVLAGDMEVNDAYRATARRLRAELEADGLGARVRWAGVARDMRGLFAASDATLNLSDFEGMSNSIMESMAHGVPVVATRTGGATELIRDGEDGLLVQRGDTDGAARHLISLDRDRTALARMGRLARAHMGAEFSVARMADRYAELYRRLAREG